MMRGFARASFPLVLLWGDTNHQSFLLTQVLSSSLPALTLHKASLLPPCPHCSMVHPPRAELKGSRNRDTAAGAEVGAGCDGSVQEQGAEVASTTQTHEKRIPEVAK